MKIDKQYDRLYTLDSTGKIRVWWMERYSNQYRTCSGVENGQIVYSEYTTAVGKNYGKKNETTDEEQAEKEILSKYKKQLKTGYFLNKSEIGSISYVEPMLAKNYKDYKNKINLKDWYLQLKYNGSRCIITKDGMFTRKGERYISAPHIFEEVKWLFDKYPNAVLDGELYNYHLRQHLNELMSLVRKTKDVSQADLDRSKQIVQYHVYDGFNITVPETASYIDRYKALGYSGINTNNIFLVLNYELQTEKDLYRYYQKFIDDGEEGIILRNKNAPYQRKRTKDLLKFKPEDDSEAVIIDVMEGEGNWSGVAKTFTLSWQGQVFDATLKGSYEEARDVLNNLNDWLGHQVTFLYNGLTGKGTPNYARIDYNNCNKVKV